MPDSPNKLSQFWQELKRRNVHRSLSFYAGSAFVFLEAVTIIFPRWGFPDWTIDLVLYLLILGAFITIIVALTVLNIVPMDKIIKAGDIDSPRSKLRGTFSSAEPIID